MRYLRRLAQIIEKVLEKLVAVLCLILLLGLFVEVANRYVFGVSWPHMQFIIPFCFVWMCLAGSALAVRRGAHFEVDLLSNALMGRAREVHRKLMTLSVLLAGLLLVWSSTGFVELGLLKKNSATGWSMVYMYASIPMGGILIALMALDSLINHIDNPQSEEGKENVS